MFKRRADSLRDSEDTLDLFKRRTREFRDLSIAASFRSAQPVLDVVDARDRRRSATRRWRLTEPPPRHVAHHSDRPGQVELWPPFAAEDAATRATKARSAGSACAIASMPIISPSGSERLIEEAPVLASTDGR